MFGQIFHIKLWLESGLQLHVLVMIKGCFYFHHSPKLGLTRPWHSSESWSSGHQFISTIVRGSKINTCFCMHKTASARLLLHRLFFFIMHAGHDAVDMSFVWLMKPPRVHVSQNVQRGLDGRCGHLGVYEFPHVLPVQWFTVSMPGYMTENRWHSGVRPNPQSTLKKKRKKKKTVTQAHLRFHTEFTQ